MLSAAHDILSNDFQGNVNIFFTAAAREIQIMNNTIFMWQSTDPIPIVPTGNSTRDCNPISTGAILLADVLPSLCMKLTTPFLLTHIRFGLIYNFFHCFYHQLKFIFVVYRTRVVMVIILSSASFMLVSFSAVQWQAFLGVVFAALSGGLGEVTFLQYSAGYHRYIIIIVIFSVLNILQSSLFFQKCYLYLVIWNRWQWIIWFLIICCTYCCRR